jgi:hypothetical protein
MMKHTIIKMTLVAAICLIGANLYSLSDGAFNLTGAPGEGDCSGCHLGNTPNSDPNGNIIISIDSTNGFYLPGKSYQVKVTINYTGKNRFGFAFTSRQAGSSLHVGDFTSDPSSGVFNRLEYVAHTRASIDSRNQKIWTFNWKAPDTINGDIQFYAAGVVANADNSNTGDLVYTKSITLKNVSSTGLFNMVLPSGKASVYPIPATSFVYIYHIDKGSIEEITLHDTHGKFIRSFTSDCYIDVDDNVRLSLGESIASGVYFLKIKHNQSYSYCKIYIR